MANGLMLTRERGHEIVVSLTDVTQLFAAPDSNPFALTEVEVLGDTGLARVIQRMLAWRVRSRGISQLTLQLPPDKIEPGMEADVAEAIRRYGTAKIEDNRLQIRSVLIHGFTQLIVVIILVAALLLIALWMLYAGIITTTSAGGLLVGIFICVFFWVTVWDPVESLAFDWIPAWRESRVLRRLMAMRVVIQPVDDVVARRPAPAGVRETGD
ncbi:MAG: hypothetical protein U0768_04680 [Anaerolineae bacterium]